MNHQGQLEKKKYRNWVRGGLAYKYLKEGIEEFADKVVQQEHTRILSAVSNTPGLTCNQCCLRNLRPLHKCENDPSTGRNTCPWRQSSCNCLYPKKQPCPNKVCDRIMEDILKSHGTTPPTPNWKNTDMQRWCSNPWEIAKCFINAPGYSDKTKAADIDTPGLLHVFINNINLQSHLSDSMTRSDIFKKTLQRRNELFHSPTMEIEDSKLNECIYEIIAILEDEQELKARHDAQQAVHKLKQLKQENFVITTHNEVEVCRDALVSVTTKSEELKQTIQDAKGDIDKKEKEVTGAIQEAKDDIGKRQKEATDTIQDTKDEISKKQNEATDTVREAKDDIDKKLKEATDAIQDAKDDIGNKQKEATDAIREAKNDIDKRQKEATKAIEDAEDDFGKKQKETTNAIQDAKDDIENRQKQATDAIQDAIDGIGKKQKEATDAFQDAKNDIGKKQKEATRAIQDAEDDFGMKQKETTDAVQNAKDDLCTKQKEAIETIQDKTQQALQEIDKHSKAMHERVGRLEIDSSISKQRLKTLESKLDEMHSIRQNHQKQLEYVERKQVLQKKLVELYQNHYVNTSISPLKLQENDINIKEVYVAPEMVMEENSDRSATNLRENASNKLETRRITRYREILQTNGQTHKQIYIVGDVGTGKSTFCKMMIQNWCSAVTHESPILANNNGNIKEMKVFDFLFFVPLQRMSGLDEITEMVKAMVTRTDIASNDFVDRIFEQESERCLIVADGLDEWTPPNNKYNLPHVSYGLPIRDRVKHATVVTLSRPSAKGILNLKLTECDQKVELLGIHSRDVECFIETYLSIFKKEGLSSWAFRKKLKISNLEHLEKSPLLLQQLVWLYCTGNEIGKSISDTYSHITNIMLSWSQSKDEGDDNDEDQICDTKQDEDMKLPGLLQRFPRCEANKRCLLPLARVASEALTSETGSTTFGRLHLRKRGVPKEAIAALIKFGILVETNCFDPTQEKTQMEFIHISYLEFFAAVYISSHFNEQKCSKLPNTILQDLFQKCKSVFDVLQLSNVLKMICGLSPFLISEISKFVSDVVSGDESMICFRNSQYMYNIVSDQIQHLILNCLSDCDSDDQPMVSLCDVIIPCSRNVSFLQRIIPESVLFLRVYAEYILDAEAWRWIARLTRLQYMYIEEGTKKNPDVGTDRPIYKFDLSKHDQLKILELKHGNQQSMEFRRCNLVKITNISTKHLEIVRLAYSNLSNIDCLLNASSLTELEISSIYTDHSYYEKRANSVVHTLHKLQKLRLGWVFIGDSALTVTPGMKNLEHIVLWHARVGLQTWCTFVDSLLTLQQSVQVDCTAGSISEWRCGDKRNYVRTNTIMFEVMEDDHANFNFRTKK